MTVLRLAGRTVKIDYKQFSHTDEEMFVHYWYTTTIYMDSKSGGSWDNLCPLPIIAISTDFICDNLSNKRLKNP